MQTCTTNTCYTALFAYFLHATNLQNTLLQNYFWHRFYTAATTSDGNTTATNATDTATDNKTTAADINNAINLFYLPINSGLSKCKT